MNYNYHICYPNKPNIERPDNSVNAEKALDIFINHQWSEELQLIEDLDDSQIHFSPSIGFKCQEDKHEIELTATLENGQIEYSLWYNRPLKKKPFFGLLPEREVMTLDDKWGFSQNEAISFLKAYLAQEYEKIEAVFSK